MSSWRIVAIIIVAIVLAIITVSIQRVDKLSEIKSYDSIIINNTEYSTSEIEDISYPYYGYEGLTIFITFKDGTVIYTDDYILKNE